MKLGKLAAKVVASCILITAMALPAFAQQSITVIRHRNSYNGNVIIRRSVTGPYGTIVTRRHYRRRHYLRRYPPTTLYMTPYGTRPYSNRVWRNGHWYYR